MIASFPMYWRPETAEATEAFWTLIASELGLKDIALTVDEGISFWQSSEMFVSQTCGLPYRAALAEKVTLVTTPDYGINGAPRGYYRSVVIAKRSLSGDVRLAMNAEGSQSGAAAALEFAAAAGLTITEAIETGSHLTSIQAIEAGDADIATIDAVTWALAKRYDAPKVMALFQTRPTPGLPIICNKVVDAATIRHALDQALIHLAPTHRETLGIKGFVDIPKAAYLAEPLPQFDMPIRPYAP